MLHNISLNVREGQLVIVVGPVGSGKSSLLSALLAEMHTLSGSVTLPASVAYTAQVGYCLTCWGWAWMAVDATSTADSTSVLRGDV